MNFLQEHWHTIALLIGGAIAWFRNEIKYYFQGKSSRESSTIENLDKAVNIYQILVEDLKKQFSDQIQAKEKEIQELRAEIEDLKLRILDLEKDTDK